MDLKILGWNSFFENNFKKYSDDGYKPARVFAEFKNLYKICGESFEMFAEISGKMRYEAIEQQDLPAVGDWVAISTRPGEDRAVIHKILPRKSKFSRKAAGPYPKEQILGSNIDTVFLVSSLNNNFNIRRMERYLILAWESGANPVIILSKADLCGDIEDKVKEVESAAIGIPIHVVSTVNGWGLDELRKYLNTGSTVALLGSSGVGKSTLINYLVGEDVQKVQEIREDDGRGRHTSTYREIFISPEGGLLLDTPGMREIKLWDVDDGISETFEDIEIIGENCRFRDCNHNKEPGCAVKEAINNGNLNIKRFESYKKLQKELQHIERKQSTITKMVENKKQKVTSKNTKDRSYLSTLD